MFSRAQGVKTLPGMHYDYILRTFLEMVTRFKHNNGQQVAIDCNRFVIQFALILFQISMICSVLSFWDHKSVTIDCYLLAIIMFKSSYQIV